MNAVKTVIFQIVYIFFVFLKLDVGATLQP
jgi:hypothetical protein